MRVKTVDITFGVKAATLGVISRSAGEKAKFGDSILCNSPLNLTTQGLPRKGEVAIADSNE